MKLIFVLRLVWFSLMVLHLLLVGTGLRLVVQRLCSLAPRVPE
jgi:hypothetical protein